MTTLTITSKNQGISFNAAESAASFAIIENLAALAGALVRAIRLPAAPAALRAAHA